MRHISKKFLSNTFHESGAMICQVETERLEDITSYEVDRPSMEASVIFKGCYGEPVTLDFSVRNDKSFGERLEKVNLMIDELLMFRNQLDYGWKTYMQDIATKRKEIENDVQPD